MVSAVLDPEGLDPDEGRDPEGSDPDEGREGLDVAVLFELDE